MRYAHVAVRTALNRLRKPDPWYGCEYTLNPYGGCEFSCPYCYSLASRWGARYRARASLDAFSRGSQPGGGEAKIFIKGNLISLLRREIRSKPKGVVFLGSATDPYQPCEDRFHLTRRCLQLLKESGWPLEVGTKSDLVLRDLDVLSEISSEGFCYIFITITTLDRELARLFEPRAPGPDRRLEVVEALSEQGIPVCVCMIPVFPGLTDEEELIAEVAEAARDHGADRFLAGALTLPGEVRERFLKLIEARFPDLLPLYQQLYDRKGYPRRDYEDRLMAVVEEVRRRLGLLGELGRGPRYS